MEFETVTSRVCQPALVYFVIATIMACCTLLLGTVQGPVHQQQNNLATFSSHMLTIIVCSLLLMGICNVMPGLSWAFVVLFIVCNLSAFVALFGAFLSSSTSSNVRPPMLG